jgi:hypothetical protein
LKEEARAVTLIPDGSSCVRVNVKKKYRDLIEAEEEVASGFVAILGGCSTISYFSNQWNLPGPTTIENRLTHETDNGAGWEHTRNRMIHLHQDIDGN